MPAMIEMLALEELAKAVAAEPEVPSGFFQRAVCLVEGEHFQHPFARPARIFRGAFLFKFRVVEAKFGK